MTNPFRSSSRHQMGSNATTDQNQGGGEKKAGFPYQVGRESSSSIAIGSKALLFYMPEETDPDFKRANFSRPIGTLSSANYRRFKMF